ncbi:hypothetical protein LCGC14_0898810 [marine sediment metagenome]|uniref:Uncharacterized protein n=1 Tax=marine sediment metagenome TaxID=412755 RepID=A0A0F9PHT0_9ZZZZ
MVDPNPAPDLATRKLHKLYSDVAHLINLQEAKNASRILLAGDIEVELPQNVKDEINTRIAAKTAEITAEVAALPNG